MSLSKDHFWAKSGGRWGGGIGKQHHIRALGGGYEGQSQNVSAWSTLGVYRTSLQRTSHHVPSQTSTLSTPTNSFFSHHPSILLFVFLLDKEQASPGGLRLFLTFTSLVLYLSIRLSLSCTCAFSCFPAGFSSSPSFFSACTWAREQLCLFLLPTSTTQQPILSVLKSPGSEKVGWNEESKERR